MKAFKYIVIAAVVIYLFHNIKDGYFKPNSNVVSIDTVEVVKIIKGKEKIIVRDSLIPVYIDKNKKYKELFKDLSKKYGRKADSLILLTELLESKKQRTYKEVFKDSILNAEIDIVATGTVDELTFNYKTHPQKVVVNEVIKKIVPKYRVLGGLTFCDGVGVSAGIQTKDITFTIGGDQKGNLKTGIYINLFQKY